MKKTITTERFAYVFLNVLLAVASAITAYGFFISENPGNAWITPIMFLPLLLPEKGMISEKHQKMSLMISGLAAVVSAALVISQIGIWILNIRYTALVFFIAVAVMAVADIAFFIAERKHIASAA